MPSQNSQEVTGMSHASIRAGDDNEELASEEPFRGRSGQPGVHVASISHTSRPTGHFANISPETYRRRPTPDNYTSSSSSEPYCDDWGAQSQILEAGEGDDAMGYDDKADNEGWGADARRFEGTANRGATSPGLGRRLLTERVVSRAQETYSSATASSRNLVYDPLYHSPRAHVKHGDLKYMLEELEHRIGQRIARSEEDNRRFLELEVRLELVEKDRADLMESLLKVKVENEKLRKRVKMLEEGVEE